MMHLVRNYSALFVIILAACVSLNHGAPTPTTDETNRKDLKRDIHLASQITTLTLTAINITFHNYCTRVPRLFTYDCNEFIKMLKARADWQMPQTLNESKLNFQDVSAVQKAMSNMSRKVNQYLNLVKQHLDIEYNIVCEPARKIELECHFPKFCATLPDTNDAIFYCNLNTTYTYMENLKLLLQLPISDSDQTNGDMDTTQLHVPQNIPILYGRWLTMLTLQTSYNQVQFIQKTLTSMSNGL